MLYNPDWDRIFTIESFAAWLASKPKDEIYCFVDAGNCAAAQYLKANGIEDYSLSSEQLYELGWMSIVNKYEGNTFGAAAKRAAARLRS